MLGLLPTSHQIGHHLFHGSVGQVLVNFVVFAAQLSGHVIRECLQLGESHPVVGDLVLSDLLLGQFYTVNVVRSHQQQSIRGKVIDDVGEAIIVALVGLLELVPDRALVAIGLSELSLLDHVGSSNELDSEVIAECLGAGNLHPDDVLGLLEVALVPIHDDVLFPPVEDVGQLLGH